MGEVWEGRDSRLDRRVAIKVSREQFSDRFDREARAVAALNHPHICTLHDVGPNYADQQDRAHRDHHRAELDTRAEAMMAQGRPPSMRRLATLVQQRPWLHRITSRL